MTIKFGTDGWRAVFADQFTMENVVRVCVGTDRAFGPSDAPVVIGHDTRFFSRRFAETAARTFIAAGRPVLMAPGPCPTPAASCQVVASGAAFALVITASHNSSDFNGVKIKDATGASAAPDVTSAIERSIPGAAPEHLGSGKGPTGPPTIVDFHPAHLDRLSRMVDLDSIRAAGLRIAVDPMHGASGRLLERILDGGATKVMTIHADPDPLFGGRHPEPLEAHLEDLRREVLDGGAAAGFATDGDADRIGAFDENGDFVSPLRIAPLLAWSLIRKGRRGPLGKTFANTILLDRIARRYDLPFTVFPVGFKHIAREMQAGRMLLGGEESGGIGIEGYIPERDGTLVSLMLLQAMVDAGKPLSEMVRDLTREFGELHYKRVDLPCSPGAGMQTVTRIRSSPPSTIGGMPVTGLDDRDGLKLLFGEEGWLLFRPSGTEPVLRIYSEAPSGESLDRIMAEALAFADPSH